MVRLPALPSAGGSPLPPGESWTCRICCGLAYRFELELRYRGQMMAQKAAQESIKQHRNNCCNPVSRQRLLRRVARYASEPDACGLGHVAARLLREFHRGSAD
jgi:hypothetical protein